MFTNHASLRICLATLLISSLRSASSVLPATQEMAFDKPGPLPVRQSTKLATVVACTAFARVPLSERDSQREQT